MISKDFAYCAKSCSNLTSDSVDNIWEYRRACLLSSKGWINSDSTINAEVKTRYNEISGLSESIKECFTKSKKKKKSLNRGMGKKIPERKMRNGQISKIKLKALKGKNNFKKMMRKEKKARSKGGLSSKRHQKRFKKGTFLF